MTKILACKSLNDELKNLVLNNATGEKIWETCGKYLKNEDLTKDEIYNIIYFHASSSIVENEMEEKLLDMLDLYSGNCSPECKLY